MNMLFVDSLPRGLFGLAIDEMARSFKDLGHHVKVCGDGIGALKYLKAHDVDVVVTTDCVSGMDPVELLWAIEKEDPEHRIIRIVLVQRLSSGESWRDWTLPCHAFVYARHTEQVILTIEQCQNRGCEWSTPSNS